MTEQNDNNEPESSKTGKVAMPGPIIVGIDFSPDSETALLWADLQATCFSAPIIVLHVVHDPAEAPGFYRRKRRDDDFLQPMEEVAEEMMKEFMAKMIHDHPNCGNLPSAVTRLVSGLPAGRIIEIAKEEQATMIVIGSRGLSGLPHLLIGSTADRVAQLSDLPVTIVKHPTKSA